MAKMNNIAMISNLVQKQLKKNGVHQLEDAFVLETLESCKIKHEECIKILSDFTSEISNLILRNETIDTETLINKYIDVMLKLDDYNINYVFEEVLNSKIEDMIFIQEQYAKNVAFVLAYYSNNVSNKIINSQLDILNSKFYNKIHTLIQEEFESYEEIYADRSDELFLLIMQLLSLYDDEDEIDIQKEDVKRYSYIESYKEMNKLAIQKGYIYKSSKGDHAKYEHKESSKCVIIPQHKLGYGISLAIQKQLEGSVA